MLDQALGVTHPAGFFASLNPAFAMRPDRQNK
jgi:hypothetical protein